MRMVVVGLGLRLLPLTIKLANWLQWMPFIGKLAGNYGVKKHSLEEAVGLCGVSPLRMSFRGLYTGRFCYLRDPKFMDVLLEKENLRDREHGEIESLYNRWVEGDLLKVVEDYMLHKRLPEEFKFISTRISLKDPSLGELVEEAIKTLTHEYVHWMITRSSSIATYIDLLSWKIRLDAMYLTEGVHREIGLDRSAEGGGMDSEGALKWISEREKAIEKVAWDEAYFETFKDLLAHFLFSYGVYLRIVKPLVECSTWPIVEMKSQADEYDDLLKEYFSGDEVEVARYYLTRSIGFLAREGFSGDGVSKLIELGRRALDIPIAEIEKYREMGKLEDLIDYVRWRFESLLGGREVTVSPEIDKKFTTVVCYLFNDRRILDFFKDKLARNPKVLTYILKIGGGGKVYEKPSIFMTYTSSDGSRSMLRYDPFAKPDEMNVIEIEGRGVKFSTLEDLVSDYPLMHRAFLLIVHSHFQSQEGELNLPAFVEELPRETQASLVHILNDMREHFGGDYRRAITIFKDPNKLEESVFGSYLKLWLYLVLRMGRYAKGLSGLHGFYG